MSRLFFTLLIALFFSQAAKSTEFVVDQRDAAASDNNPGNREKPFKTISAAASKVHAGDKVIIHGGDYRETVIITASGTTEAPIIFEAAPGETPVIKGSEILKKWVRETPNVWKAKMPSLPPRSDKTDNPSFWNTNDVRQVFVKDGVLLDAIHLRPMTTKDKLQSGSFFCDGTNNELYVWLQESHDANNLTIEASMRGVWLYVFGSNITIRGLQMRHSSTLAITNWPACSLKGDDIVLEDCQLSWADYVGVHLEGNKDKLLHCQLACHGNSAINGTGQEHVIERCRVIYNNVDRYDTSWHCGGGKLIPRFSRGRITHSEFAYNIGPGLWLDDGCNDNLIESNFCHDNEGPGIMVEISAGNRVFNNVCFSNRNPLAGDFLRPDPEAVKRAVHNIFTSVRRGGEALRQPRYHAGDGRGIYISSSPNSKVYHNTCYLNEGEGICVEGKLRQAIGGVAMSTLDCEVLNNISVYNKGTQLVVRRNDEDNDTHGNRSDYNLLLALGAVFTQAGWDSPFVFSLKEWQKQTGHDRHSIEADPAFAMAAMADFRLLPISAAAHAGQPLDNVRHDFFGSPRPSDKVSLGACECTALDYPRPAVSYLEGFAAQ